MTAPEPVRTTAELAELARAVAEKLTITIKRPFDGAEFTYAPTIELRADGIRVRVPVNAVLTKGNALFMINQFRCALYAAAGTSKIVCRTTRSKSGGLTPIHVSGSTHMGVFHVDGYWMSMRVAP
jgi:hypothetical protein